jgi:hypothetical protein
MFAYPVDYALKDRCLPKTPGELLVLETEHLDRLKALRNGTILAHWSESCSGTEEDRAKCLIRFDGDRNPFAEPERLKALADVVLNDPILGGLIQLSASEIATQLEASN